MMFLVGYIDVFSNINFLPVLLTYTVMGYSTKTPINNKIAWINIIFQHNFITTKYSYSGTNSLTCF